MSITRRFPLVFAAALLATGLVVGATSARAQGAAWDPPTGVGKTTQATGDIVSEPTAPAAEPLRFLLPGTLRFSPSLTFWPSATRLARLQPARYNSPEGARRPVLGPNQRQRMIGR